MSDSNAVRLGYIREVAEGTTPATPAFTRFRYTSAPDLGQKPTSVESDEILDDGQRSDLIPVGKEVGGSAGMELSFVAHDTFYEAGLRGTFQARTTKTQATHGMVTTSTTIALSDTSGLAIGDLVATEGYTNAANNGLFQISTVSAGVSITVTLIGGGAPGLVVETPTSSAVLRFVGRHYTSGIGIGAPSGGVSVLTGVGTNFTSMSLEPGDFIKLGGFATAPNNAFVRIVSITSATVMAVDRLPVGFAAEAATANRIFVGERLKNGTDRYSYTLQELFTDIGTAPNNTRQILTGMGVNTINLDMDSEAIVKGQITFVGQTGGYDTAPIAGESFVEAAKWTPMNTSYDVARVAEGGNSLVTNLPQKLSIVIDNALTKRKAIGRPGGAGFRRGQLAVSGTLDLYFDDKTKAEKVTNGTESSIDLQLSDSSGHAIVIDIPRVKYRDGQPPVPGRNDDVVVSLQWDALKDKTLLYTMKYIRFYRVA